MSDEPTGPPAGWYPDPSASGRQRYWDGSTWTEYTDENYAQKAGTDPAATKAAAAPSGTPTTQPAPAPGGPPGVPAAGTGHQAWVAPAPRTSGMAIGALVSGILSIVVCFTALPVGVVLGPVAIVLAIRAKRAIAGDPSQTGRGMATAGLVTGIIGVVIGIGLTIFWIVAVSDPSFQEGFSEGFNEGFNP